jgi:hemin uptake protein HemP
MTFSTGLERSPKVMADAHSHDSRQSAEEGASSPQADPARVIRSEEIFAGERVVLIQHAGERYRLLITRNDRLILQK